jgi:hypothetical protein
MSKQRPKSEKVGSGNFAACNSMRGIEKYPQVNYTISLSEKSYDR